MHKSLPTIIIIGVWTLLWIALMMMALGEYNACQNVSGFGEAIGCGIAMYLAPFIYTYIYIMGLIIISLIWVVVVVSKMITQSDNSSAPL